MIDCFVSTRDKTLNRIDWSRRTLMRLLENQSLFVTVLDAGSDPEQLAWFRKHNLNIVVNERGGSVFRRFLLAEKHACSDIYLLCDNDIVPIREDWLEYGLGVMERHPQFGYVVGRMEHCDFSFDNGQMDQEIRSVVKGGGLGFIRKGCRTAPFEIPATPDPDFMDDWHYCQAIKKSGYAMGMFEQLYVKHIGKSESTKLPSQLELTEEDGKLLHEMRIVL